MTLTRNQVMEVAYKLRNDVTEVKITEGTIEGFVIVAMFDENDSLVRDLTIRKDGRVIYQNVKCETCGNCWDSMSPCALCNASRSA